MLNMLYSAREDDFLRDSTFLSLQISGKNSLENFLILRGNHFFGPPGLDIICFFTFTFTLGIYESHNSCRGPAHRQNVH